ncbi:MAG: IS21 family transposase [Actinomycetota bacterium]
MDLYELIRIDDRSGMSKRSICKKHRVGKETVNQAINNAVPPERKKPVRTSPVLTGEIKDFIDGILQADNKAPRKQRHTARRIWQRVTEEFDSPAKEVTVRRYVRTRKRQLALGVQAFVPQHHPAGAQFEVDFYEALINFTFGAVVAKIISVRSEFSGASFHVAYPAQTQSAFLEGVALGLEFLGGVPARIRFDNLKQAVARILRGKRRIQQDRFVAFRSHYLFDADFTTPGLQGAHEKGGVENEAGRFRRRWLVPVPVFSSWAELNDYLAACCVRDLDRTAEGKTHTIGELAYMEKEFLQPLPAERFETGQIGEGRVDQKARVTVKTNRYSVPASLVGRRVSWRMSPMTLEFSYESRAVATHDLVHLRFQDVLVLDHYLEVLADKPGAFPGALPLHQARMSGDFPKSYDRLWQQLCERSDQTAGTRQMIDVLLLHRSYPKKVMLQAVEQALQTGAIDPSMVELFARRLTSKPPAIPQDVLDVGDLSRFDRPLPEMSSYDALLGEAVGK